VFGISEINPEKFRGYRGIILIKSLTEYFLQCYGDFLQDCCLEILPLECGNELPYMISQKSPAKPGFK
jgi:hypothetical protein